MRKLCYHAKEASPRGGCKSNLTENLAKGKKEALSVVPGNQAPSTGDQICTNCNELNCCKSCSST